MMDWISFFDSRHIHYATSGPNVARGNVCIKCCWCGHDDPGEHLSINLAGKGFRCWRNPTHSGKNPAKLIQALINCSWEQAQQLAGQEKALPSDFLGKLKAAFVKPEKATQKQKLKLPVEFKPFSNKPSALPFWAYLKARGFSHDDGLKANDYGIYYASQGNYKGRIVFTVTVDNELVGWTGRTIYKSDQVRYKTLTHDQEKANERGEIPAPAPISDYLLFHDRLDAARYGALVLCEGPFDAWRVNLLGDSIGVCATCFFTSTLSKQQLNRLHSILPRFGRKVLLLDEGTFAKSAKIRADLVTLDVEVCRLPIGIKDPGELLSTRVLNEVLNKKIRRY